MRGLTYLLGLAAVVEAIIYSDTNCVCAGAKSTTSTPLAATSIAAGCSTKTDWNGTVTDWCLTDQMNGLCGIFQTGFGYIDSCSSTNFTSLTVAPPSLIEWDQTPNQFYSGQTINISWATQNIGPDEAVRITYQGVNSRTLTSSALTGQGYFTGRLSDSTNAVTAGFVPITVGLNAWPALFIQSPDVYQFLQSKLQNVVALDGVRLLGGGQNSVCDSRNLTLTWRGLGQAQFGFATVSLNRNGGFGGSSTLGTQQTNIPVSANTTITFLCPRGSNPSTISSYSFQISVAEPGQNAYTTSSASFNVAQAATPSPTSSTTPTASRTPSVTPSITPSPTSTPTPSITPSSTPSASQTSSVTPSTSASRTPTPAPSLDIAAIAARAAAGVDTTTPVIAGVVGTAVFLIALGAAFYFYQQKQLKQARLRKQAFSSKLALENEQKYFKNTNMADPTLVVYGRMTPPTKRAFDPAHV